MSRKHDPCPRDVFGFCLLATYGWPKCYRGDGNTCDEKDPHGNLENARLRRIGKISKTRVEA